MIATKSQSHQEKPPFLFVDTAKPSFAQEVFVS
jgi:hypothetical protein